MIRAIDRVIFEDASWRKFCALNDIDFLHVEYESFIQDPSGTCRRIASHMGVGTDHVFSLERSDFLRESDELSRDWVRRIKATAAY